MVYLSLKSLPTAITVPFALSCFVLVAVLLVIDKAKNKKNSSGHTRADYVALRAISKAGLAVGAISLGAGIAFAVGMGFWQSFFFFAVAVYCFIFFGFLIRRSGAKIRQVE